MNYQNVYKGIFLKRPNRFIAHVQIDGREEICHVRNTGRCKELLVAGATVYLEKSRNPNRKTAYSVIAVEKGDRLINIDSQAPNTVCEEALAVCVIKIPGFMDRLIQVKREVVFGNSRFDLEVKSESERAFVEVKGVTLEENDIAMFPDAPTQRGIKHVYELIKAKQQGYQAAIVFIVQMENIRYFTPNAITQPAFKDALLQAEIFGVSVLAYDCIVTPDTLQVNQEIPIKLK